MGREPPKCCGERLPGSVVLWGSCSQGPPLLLGAAFSWGFHDGPCLSYSPTAWQPWAHLQAHSLAQPWPSHRELAWCNFVFLCMCVWWIFFYLLIYLFIFSTKLKSVAFILHQVQMSRCRPKIISVQSNYLRCQFSVLQIRLANDFNVVNFA